MCLLFCQVTHQGLDNISCGTYTLCMLSGQLGENREATMLTSLHNAVMIFTSEGYKEESVTLGGVGLWEK